MFQTLKVLKGVEACAAEVWRVKGLPSGGGARKGELRGLSEVLEAVGGQAGGLPTRYCLNIPRAFLVLA